MSVRYDYIDVAKGLGILAVVWAHIMLVGWSHQIIYAFHMPLFFFVAGMLFRREKYDSFKAFAGKRAKRLLLPYLIYSIVTWGIWALFRWLRHDPVDSYWMPLLQTFIAQGSGQFLVHNSALWFIPCLFVVEMMYWGISKLRDGYNLFVCFLLAGISFLLGHLFGDKYWFLLPFNFDAALIALPFYSVGNILVKRHPHEELMRSVSSHPMYGWSIFLASAALLVLSALSFGECSMGSSSYQCNGAVFTIRAFLGCFSLILFSLLVTSRNVLPAVQRPFIWFGKNSLDIMCLHVPIKGVAIILAAYVLKMSADGFSTRFGLALIPFIVTMIAISIVIALFNRTIRK